ncbi:unnamed protein product, partial [Symbiodinium sp. CCMP2456]
AASWLCENDAAAQDTAAPQLTGATLLDRQLKLLNLTNLSAEDFSRKEGVVADQKWLELAIASQRKVEPSLWMLYREWVDDVIDGQVEHVDAWHHFVVARAFGLNPSLTKSVKPGEAADLLALLAEDRKLGDSTANESLESWLEESREAFDFRFRKAHHRCFDGLSFAEEGDWQGSFSFVQIADPQPRAQGASSTGPAIEAMSFASMVTANTILHRKNVCTVHPLPLLLLLLVVVVVVQRFSGVRWRERRLT